MGTASGCEFPSAGTNVITPPSTACPSSVTFPFTVPRGGPWLQPISKRPMSKQRRSRTAILCLEFGAEVFAAVDRAGSLPHVEDDIVGDEADAAIAQRCVYTNWMPTAGGVVLVHRR